MNTDELIEARVAARIKGEANLSARQYAGGLKKLKNWLSANKDGVKAKVGKRQTRQNR